jgi:predicted exporter/SAM-dependent methyltransferase
VSRAGERLRRGLAAGLVLLGVPAAAWLGFTRLHVETDITRALPRQDPVLTAAGRILGQHPALDRVVIDLNMSEAAEPDPDRLVEAAVRLQAELEASGLFRRVGATELAAGLPVLFSQVFRHLPVLFDQRALESELAPRLTPKAIRAALGRALEELADLQGVGQADALARDPFRFREVVLGRLRALDPTAGARPYRGQLLSADGRHLLLAAEPRGVASDTSVGRPIAALLERLAHELATPAEGGAAVRLIPVGTYRAALDNEEVVRADTERAVLWATLGVILLLLICFPRPWIGLFSLVPALAGASLALLVYSLLHDSISALALGFGGALVTITVDQGIAFLLFLDRRQASGGRAAAREVWSVGLFATLTTSAAFLSLYVTGFELLGQLGLFAALGVVFAFLFVHTVFPWLLPGLKPARRGGLLPIERWLERVCAGRGLVGLGLGLLLAASLLAPGLPGVQVDLAAMNTVRPETEEAEAHLAAAWGDLFQNTYLLMEAPDTTALQLEADGLADLLDRELEAGGLSRAFSPAHLLPGPARAERNLAAWREFFSPARVAGVRAELARAGQALGFAEDAFEPFLDSLASPSAARPELPAALLPLLGVEPSRTGQGLVWLGQVQPGPRYQAEAFALRAADAGLAVFDPGLFTARLSKALGHSFLLMLAVVGAAVVLLLLLLFADLLLTLVTLLPLGAALAATLGALRLLDHPIDIPALMLSIVVLGMGVDYALYLVRGQQRHLDERHPDLGPLRVTVLLAGGTTLVGMLTMVAAEHRVPRSAGVTCALGVAFALLFTFLLLPPLLGRVFRTRPFPGEQLPAGSARHRALVRARYRHLPAYPRLFARFKLALDPMFARLDELVGPARRVLDIGCGLGVPATFLLARRPGLELIGLEPDPERVRVAARAVGERGRICLAAAPELSGAEGRFDVVLLLDVVHHLDDRALAATLEGARARLAPAGRLVVRADVPGRARLAWERWLEAARVGLAGRRPRWRTRGELGTALEAAGFELRLVEPSAPGREETWLLAAARDAREPSP